MLKDPKWCFFFFLSFFGYVLVLVPFKYSLDWFHCCSLLWNATNYNTLEMLVLNWTSLFEEERPIDSIKSIMLKKLNPGASSTMRLAYFLFLSTTLLPNRPPPPLSPLSWKTKQRDLWTWASTGNTVNPNHCVRFMLKISLEVCAYQTTAIRKLCVYLFLKMC